jgi:ribonuclease BN (tRNA processing enzyme)
MDGFRIVVAGVGDAFSARYYSSCFAVVAGERWLLVDCPHPIRKMLAEASQSTDVKLDFDRFDGVLITHLHADHCSGLEGLAYYFRYVLGRKLPLVIHPDVVRNLWGTSLAAGMERSVQADGRVEERRLEDFFELCDLSDSCTIGPFTIRARLTKHSIATTAFHISAMGHSIGYSADTTFDPALVEWLSSADLIVHEAGGVFPHTSIEELAGLPATLTRRMRVIHYPDAFDMSASPIEPLRQGACYNVG